LVHVYVQVRDGKRCGLRGAQNGVRDYDDCDENEKKMKKNVRAYVNVRKTPMNEIQDVRVQQR
jgi:hypothetical protein